MQRKDVRDHLAQVAFIFRQQDSFSASMRIGAIGISGGVASGRGGDGQEDLEGRADTDFALDLDPALVLFNDSVNRGESKAGTLADFLRRKERFEKVAEDFGFDAATSIGDGETNEGTRAGFRIILGDFGRDISGAGFDDQLSTTRHRIAGIDAEIDDDLLDGATVGMNLRQIGTAIGFEKDVFADEFPEHCAGALDDFAEIDAAELHDLLAAESEQLPDEIGSPLGGLADFADGFGVRAHFAELHEEHAGMAINNGQDIIEIVGDPGGELTDGFHFLGLAELAFKLETGFALNFEPVVGRLELAGAERHHLSELIHFKVSVPVEFPFAGKGMSELQHFDVVKRFFKDDEIGGRADAGAHLLPGIIGIGSANDYLQFGVSFPEMDNSFEAIPSRGHAHIDEGEGKGFAGSAGLLDFFEGFLALIGGIEFELSGRRGGGIGLAEKGGFDFEETVPGIRDGSQNFPEIVVNGHVVIDNENTVIFDGYHTGWRSVVRVRRCGAGARPRSFRFASRIGFRLRL